MKISRHNTILSVALIMLTTPMMANAVIKTSQVSENQIKIGFSNSEIASEEGRQALEKRIRGAARKLCGHVGPVKVGLKEHLDNQSCAKGAIDKAMDSINKQLTAS